MNDGENREFMDDAHATRANVIFEDIADDSPLKDQNARNRTVLNELYDN